MALMCGASVVAAVLVPNTVSPVIVSNVYVFPPIAMVLLVGLCRFVIDASVDSASIGVVPMVSPANTFVLFSLFVHADRATMAPSVIYLILENIFFIIFCLIVFFCLYHIFIRNAILIILLFYLFIEFYFNFSFTFGLFSVFRLY